MQTADVILMVLEGKRPEITKQLVEECSLSILKSFPSLIKLCWDHDPKIRPYFSEVLKILSPK